jgi:cysteine synthase
MGEGDKKIVLRLNMSIRQGLVDAIGNTPLIRLKHVSEETGCEIYGKAEFMNPGGSVKDRAARGIIEDYEARGVLKPNGILIEGTAGNTGIGFAHVCNARGYRSIIVMPDNQAPEKYAQIEAMGAQVVKVKAVPYADPNHYQRVAKRMAEETKDAVWGNQFDNIANRQAHERTTGPEIWEQTQGKIDAFVTSTGTGGTLAGVSRALKAKNRNVKVFLADPQGSALYNWVKTGELKVEGPGSITEGIGTTRVTQNLADTPLDDSLHIVDSSTVNMVYRLLREEGLYLGSTSGVNVAAAVDVAKKLGPGHTIVTILCDSGVKYQTRLFNKQWLAEKGLTSAIV